MRIVWKDSSVRQKSSRLYRGIEIVGFENGWKIGLDDGNVYKSLVCCQNAIDKVLGGCGAKNTAHKRRQDIFVRNGASWTKIQ